MEETKTPLWQTIQNEVIAHLLEPETDIRVHVVHMPRRSGKSYVLTKFIEEKEKQGNKFRILVPCQGVGQVESMERNLKLEKLKHVEVVVDYHASEAFSRMQAFDCLWLDNWQLRDDSKQVQMVAKATPQVVCIGTPSEERSNDLVQKDIAEKGYINENEKICQFVRLF